MQTANVWFEKICAEFFVESNNSISAAIKYKLMPRIKSFRLSLRSIIWPAYNANEIAGTTSLKPSKPIANGAFVKL